MRFQEAGRIKAIPVKGIKRRVYIMLMLLSLLLPFVLSAAGCGTGGEAETAKQNDMGNFSFRGQKVLLPEGMSLNPSLKPCFIDGSVICAVTVPREVQEEEEISVLTDDCLIRIDSEGAVVWTRELLLSDDENAVGGILHEDAFSILIADSNGNSFIIRKLGGEEVRIALPSAGEAYIYLTEDSKGYLWAASEHEVAALNEDGSVKFTVPFDGRVHAVAAGDNGAWIVLYDGSVSAVSIGPDGAVSARIPISYAEGITIDEGILYVSTDNGVMCESGGSFSLFADYLKSNLSSVTVRLLSVPDEDHILFARSIGLGYELALYHRRNPGETESARTLEIGCATRYGLSQYLTDRIVSFNSIHEDIQIEITDYHDTYSDIEAAEEALARDLVTGVYRPDLLIYDLGMECAYQKAAVEHGLTLDLTAYLKIDDNLNMDSIFGSALRGCRYEDQIWGLPVNMTLSTLAVPDSMLGNLAGHESWSLAEELDFLESLPAEVTPCVNCAQDTALEVLLGENGLGMFLDHNKGRCSFDSIQFIRLLRYIAGRPKNWDELIKVSPADKATYNQRAQYYYSGKVAMKSFYVTGVLDFISLNAQFGTDEVTLIGYPVPADAEKGSGVDVTLRDTLSIMTFCDSPTDAWEFLRYTIVCEQGSPSGISFLSSYKPNLSKQAQIGTYTLFKTDGTFITDTLSILENMNKSNIGIIRELTQADVDQLFEILNNAGVSRMEAVPSTVKEIVWEEISAMTAGVSSPEECAKKIQSRASLWMTEHH